jgi:hypothetical protein
VAALSARTALVALAALAGAASHAAAQVQYQMRITPVGTTPVSGGATQWSFMVEARASATTGLNYGISRAGPNGTTPATRSQIALAEGPAALQIGRALLPGSATQRGRASAFRYIDPRHGAAGQTPAQYEAEFSNGPNQQNIGLLAGNENGFVQNSTQGRLIAMWDAYSGFLRPDNGANPWGTPVGAGEWTPWTSLYNFMIQVPASQVTPVNVRLTAQAGLAIGTRTQQFGNDWILSTSPQTLTTADLSLIVPGVGPGAALGLAGLVALRRRR